MYLLHHPITIHCINTFWIALCKGNLITYSNLQAKQMEEAISLADKKKLLLRNPIRDVGLGLQWHWIQAHNLIC